MAKEFVCVQCGKRKIVHPHSVIFFILQPEDRANLKLFASMRSKREPGWHDTRCKPIPGFSMIGKQACWRCVQKLQNKRWQLAYLVIKELKSNIEWMSKEQEHFPLGELERMRSELAEKQKVLDGMPFILKENVKPKYDIMADYSIT